ncbi:MAG: hypothetical protein Q8N42_01995, partial [bacterium]|nr:hypothetical protein [bacterium]
RDSLTIRLGQVVENHGGKGSLFIAAPKSRRKMKGFLAKRWHGIPVSILTAVLLVCLLASSALAAYLFWNGSAKVTVTECMTVTNLGGDNGDFNADNLWIISMKPGETKLLNVRVSNSSSVALTVNLSAVESYTNIDAAWSLASAVIAGGNYADFTLTVFANGSIVPGEYTIPLTITRQ